MKQVWKCDFCYKTDINKSVISEHEKICSSNPLLKFCYSCKYHNYEYESPYCKIKLDVYDGEDIGNCIGWESNDIKLLRKVKLNNIKTSL